MATRLGVWAVMGASVAAMTISGEAIDDQRNQHEATATAAAKRTRTCKHTCLRSRVLVLIVQAHDACTMLFPY